MLNWKKGCLRLACLVLAVLMLVSCGSKSGNDEGTTTCKFENSITKISMRLPKGWSSDRRSMSDPYSEHSFVIDNGMNHSLNSDNGVQFELMNPYCVGDVDIGDLKKIDDKAFAGIEACKKIQCGKNTLYFSNPTGKSFVYIDKIVILPIYFNRLPKSGITPEMESIFASLHIN